MAAKTVLASIGIDLEFQEPRSIAGLEGMIAPEGLPPLVDSNRGTLLVFSAKEAVYKAFYPLEKRVLGFEDVRLEWRLRDGDRFEALAECPGRRVFDVQSKIVDDWFVSSAVPGQANSDIDDLDHVKKSNGRIAAFQGMNPKRKVY
jgi:4'-phosphopantetheinyl transferase EntD